MALTLKELLRTEAKFRSPVTHSHATNVPDLDEQDVERLQPEWKPVSVRHDSDMVDALIRTLEDYLGDRPFYLEDKPSWACLDSIFRMNQEFKGMSWTHNTSAADAELMVFSGVIESVLLVVHQLGCDYRIFSSHTERFKSKADFVLGTNEGAKVLVEVVAPSVMDKTFSTLENPTLRLKWVRGRPFRERMLNKVCLYMGCHKARYLALTSHDKWVFFRLHHSTSEPYVTFSSVECQSDSTKPLRLLLSVMLSDALNIDVDLEFKAELSTMV